MFSRCNGHRGYVRDRYDLPLMIRLRVRGRASRVCHPHTPHRGLNMRHGTHLRDFTPEVHPVTPNRDAMRFPPIAPSLIAGVRHRQGMALEIGFWSCHRGPTPRRARAQPGSGGPCRRRVAGVRASRAAPTSAASRSCTWSACRWRAPWAANVAACCAVLQWSPRGPRHRRRQRRRRRRRDSCWEVATRSAGRWVVDGRWASKAL